MCLVLPCQVRAVIEEKAIVEFAGEKITAANLVKARVNDFVLVREGLIIEKLEEKEGREKINALKMVLLKKKKKNPKN